MLLLTIIAALLASSPQGAPKSVTTKVKVDGASYRVRTRGAEVEVASKGLIAVKSISHRDRMRRAVKVATGCEIIDELTISPSIMQGRLSCENGRPAL